MEFSGLCRSLSIPARLSAEDLHAESLIVLWKVADQPEPVRNQAVRQRLIDLHRRERAEKRGLSVTVSGEEVFDGLRVFDTVSSLSDNPLLQAIATETIETIRSKLDGVAGQIFDQLLEPDPDLIALNSEWSESRKVVRGNIFPQAVIAHYFGVTSAYVRRCMNQIRRVTEEQLCTS